MPSYLAILLVLYTSATLILTTLIYRLHHILTRPAQHKPNAHLLIVLGSGGHTAEMLSILQTLGTDYITTRFKRRTYIVSSGDTFSAKRARDYEASLGTTKTRGTLDFEIVVVRRARRVHQSLLSTPLSAMLCLWDCLRLEGDLVLTNGPGTGVVVVLAGVLRMVFGGRMVRSVYVESWARVRTLSLSGRILRWVVSRFCVQWKGIADEGRGRGWGRREYIGTVVA